MIQAASHLEQAEKALRQVICDLLAVAPSSPNVYETVLELAEIGKKMQQRIAAELQDDEAQRALCVGANI